MKKFFYWLPRVMAIVFAVVPILSATISSFQISFELRPYLMFVILSAILGFLAFIGWKRPLVGGFIYGIFGLILFFGAINTSIGIDYGGVFLGAVPFLVTSGAFIYEGYKEKKK